MSSGSIFIEFKNETDEFTLKFDTVEANIGYKWLQAVNNVLNYDGDPIREADRFYNFPSHNWTESRIVDILNDCIAKINNYKQFIDITAQVGGDHNHHNQLHKYFELMRGFHSQPTDFFKNAPHDIQMTINLYNNSIHRLENHLESQGKSLPRIVITFKKGTRYKLADEDFDNFKTYPEFGTIYLDYCEVGKTLLNVFHDSDSVIGDKSILPQRYYAADMCIKFYNGTGEKLLAGFDEWWVKNEQYLNDLGFYKGDKTLAIGYLPVAKLDFNGMTKKQIIHKVDKFTKINRVYTHINN